jgi:hypothetical protein
MIRFFINLIQYCLALILVVVGLVFLGPLIVEYVDRVMAKTEDSTSVTEQFETIARVRELLNEKEISEVSLKDLLRLIDSADSGELGPDDAAESRQLQLEQLGLSLSDVQELSFSDIQALRRMYEEFLGAEDEATPLVAPSSAVDEGIRRSDGMASPRGL